jgi:hypothetical protein
MDTEDDVLSKGNDSDAARFPVVITTYEMIIKDRVHLSGYDFSYIGMFRLSHCLPKAEIRAFLSGRRRTSSQESGL